MLDVAFDRVRLHLRSSGASLDFDLRFAAGRHTAIIGPEGAGKTRLLHLVAGEARPDSGEITIGRQIVNRVPASGRPVMLTSRDASFPERWTVRHALVASLQRRRSDRDNRLDAFDSLVEDWELGRLLDRRMRDLSSSERLRVRLARIEGFHPAILLSERLFDGASWSAVLDLAGTFHRAIRGIGSTLIAEISHAEELTFYDRLVVVSEGRVVQEGLPQAVIEAPCSVDAARAGGPVNQLDVTIEGNRARSVIGEWTVHDPPFQGAGIALARPWHFRLVPPGEESDFVLAIDTAAYGNGDWHITGLVTGGSPLEVRLPGTIPIHKGKLLALACEPSRFVLVRGAAPSARSSGRPPS